MAFRDFAVSAPQGEGRRINVSSKTQTPYHASSSGRTVGRGTPLRGDRYHEIIEEFDAFARETWIAARVPRPCERCVTVHSQLRFATANASPTSIPASRAHMAMSPEIVLLYVTAPVRVGGPESIAAAWSFSYTRIGHIAHIAAVVDGAAHAAPSLARPTRSDVSTHPQGIVRACPLLSSGDAST